MTVAELTRTLGKVLRRPTLVGAVVRLLLLGRELAEELLFSSARVTPQVLRDAGYDFAHPDLEGASFAPRPRRQRRGYMPREPASSR